MSRIFRPCGFLVAGTLLAALMLTACGGSSIGISGSSTDCTKPSGTDSNGCTYVSFTDAPGDFITYKVNVTNLTLVRSNSTTVNVVPATTTVDFAQLDGLDEFLTLASMPPGTYVSGSITLDYTNADIEVQDASGNALKVAPVDQNGNPITTLTLAIKLDGLNQLVLLPGVPRLFQVDFNLTASNTVNLSNSTVTVQPFLVADVDPNLSNQLQVRGPLSAVDTAGGDFTLEVRPFYAGSAAYGDLRVFTGNNTVYDINQTGYTGSAGLTALSAAGATTAVIAKGSFNFTNHEFIASEVYAGSSVPGGTLDAAEGVVLSRSGNIIVLRGATLYRTGQTVTFNDSVTVTVGTGTRVREAGSPTGSFDISNISVGQDLLVFGTLTSANPSSLALDASSGFARLQYTKLDGLVTAAPAIVGATAQMTVNVQNIEGRPVSLFNFAGTGTSAGNDANPASYTIALPNLLSGINNSDPVRVWGFVTPFGSAPPDFGGTTVADYVNANALLAISWPGPGCANAFTSMGSSGMVINMASMPSPLLAVLRQGGVVTQLSSLTTAPTVQASAGVFAILQNGTVQVHVTFAGFLSDLSARLNGGAKIRGYFARGGFASGTDVMTAGGIAVVVQ